jgi:hypothetical protein
MRALLLFFLLGCGDGTGAGPDARPADAASLTCDTVAQDCTAPAAMKCTLIQVGSAGVPRCVTVVGFVASGNPCVRGEIGRDDCAPGLYCSGLGFPSGNPPQRVCRRFCRDAAGCAAGESCVKLSDETPPDGICVPASCALFTPGCPSGMTCDAVELTTAGQWAGVCRSPGSGEPGGPCVEVDCVAGAHCQRGATPGSATCRLLCDATHPCPAGTCEPFSGLPNGGGLCR